MFGLSSWPQPLDLQTFSCTLSLFGYPVSSNWTCQWGRTIQKQRICAQAPYKILAKWVSYWAVPIFLTRRLHHQWCIIVLKTTCIPLGCWHLKVFVALTYPANWVSSIETRKFHLRSFCNWFHELCTHVLLISAEISLPHLSFSVLLVLTEHRGMISVLRP